MKEIVSGCKWNTCPTAISGDAVSRKIVAGKLCTVNNIVNSSFFSRP